MAQLSTRGWSWRAAIWMLLGFVAAGGCGSADKSADPDYSALSDLVIDLSDLALDEGRFRQQFASGSQPDSATRQQYKRYLFKLAADPKIEGDTATMQVLVCSIDSEIPVEWTAVRESGQWKLTSAPLK